MNFFKTYWHCVKHALFGKREPMAHQFVTTIYKDGIIRHWCSCGYLNDGITYEEWQKEEND